MHLVKFKRYNPGAEDKIVVVEQITHLESIGYNGVQGTRIYLTNGTEIHVGEYPTDVQKKITEVLKE